jgi:hypothetical protein
MPPKPNYAFEKRQRELEAKRKKAEKAARKAHAPAESSSDGAPPADDPADVPPAGTDGQGASA